MTKTIAAAGTLGLALAFGLGLAACETATPYQPLQHGTHVSGGFSDQRLDDDHFRVMFKGNTVTSRATVESYLLYRSAQITVDHGYDWFETEGRHTHGEKETWVDPYGPGYGWGYFRPYWRVYGPGYGWRGWGPWGPGYEISTVEKFEASTEITLHHGPKPAGDPRALDAREVMTNLGPKLQHPKA